MKKITLLLILISGLFLTHCPDDDDDSSDTGADADTDADTDVDTDADTDADTDTDTDDDSAPPLSCGEVITQVQLEDILLESVEYNEEASSGCEFNPLEGMSTGTISVYTGGEYDYDLMLSGAQNDLSEYGEVTETNDIGLKSFEFVGDPFGMQTVEVGFLDSTGKYAVLVTTVLSWAEVETVREIAETIDFNISSI